MQRFVSDYVKTVKDCHMAETASGMLVISCSSTEILTDATTALEQVTFMLMFALSAFLRLLLLRTVTGLVATVLGGVLCRLDRYHSIVGNKAELRLCLLAHSSVCTLNACNPYPLYAAFGKHKASHFDIQA